MTLLHATYDANMTDRPILFVGTAAEYGSISPGDLPLRETSKCQPYNYYGMSKLMQTLAVIAAAESENRRILIVRPFNIIGAGMPGHLALASFVRQLQEIRRGTRAPIIKVGNLNSRRDFIDVEDVVRLCWLLIRTEIAYGEIVNLCTGIATSVAELLDLLIKASGLAVGVAIAPDLYKELDIELHYGSNEKAGRLIGDFAYTSIEQTIQQIAP
jgi:GDP-4-dehydro-6-deoxy-D-mannose reductase